MQLWITYVSCAVKNKDQRLAIIYVSAETANLLKFVKREPEEYKS